MQPDTHARQLLHPLMRITTGASTPGMARPLPHGPQTLPCGWRLKLPRIHLHRLVCLMI